MTAQGSVLGDFLHLTLFISYRDLYGENRRDRKFNSQKILKND
jgi:hypothetical protein